MNTENTDLSALFEIIGIVEEPRDIRGRRYPLDTLLFIALCTILCGGETFNDMEAFAETRREWLKRYVSLPSCPTHDTFNRFFQVLSVQAMDGMLRNLNALIQGASPPKTIAFDGKTVRGSVKNGKAIHLLNAWGCETRLALGQLEVDRKSNEITELPKLMDALELKGALVTVDALNTQKATAARVVEKKADYLLPLKANHPTDQSAVSYIMKDIAGRREADVEQVDKDHGRVEIRRCWQTDDLSLFLARKEWKGLKTLARIDRIRIFPNGERSEESVVYLSSLSLDPKRVLDAARGHWGIENQLHWCLDIVFKEDQCRARTRHATRCLSTVRAFSLNVLRRCAKKGSLRIKRYKATLSTDYLEDLLTLV